MRSFAKRRAALAFSLSALLVVLLTIVCFDVNILRRTFQLGLAIKKRNNGAFLPYFSRKLLEQGSGKVARRPDRIGEACSKDDIMVYQGPTSPLPNGIPTYTVEILNVCDNGCTISGIHLTCGWFSSARMINPKVFKRLSYNDCLVNNGEALSNGGSLSFQYANTYPYPLTVSSVSCHHSN